MKKRVVMLLTLCASLFALAIPLRASALTGAEFQAGHIIDDAVFYNKSTMSTGDIQKFLNARVPNCDTEGKASIGGMTIAERGNEKGSPPPYTCLKDYHQDTTSKDAMPGLCNGYVGKTNQSAAQIIYDVAQSCGINPQALIVLLQKEQGLVDDTSPWPGQYRTATGYACPDFAPCDTEFFGLFNQLYYASKQFKNYALNPGEFMYVAGRNNVVQFNPEASCGATTVTIRNQATAGLYNYTPYVPNLPALANLYGEGNGCSAYGNRNFWRNFNDWFGSTYTIPNTVPTPKPPVSAVPGPLSTGLINRPLLFGLQF